MPIAGSTAPDRAARAGVNRDAVKRRRRHRHALVQMTRTAIPFLVGGGYALRHYTKGVRGTKDLDIFACRRDAVVDGAWFTHAVPATVLGVPVRLCPPEEMIWSKAFVMERERYDGADISHLIRACHGQLDWHRLMARFGPHWRVLLNHLTLFGFIYPGERACIPSGVMLALCRQLERESRQPASDERLCQGTLLSREQYLTDVSRWGYADGRLAPHGPMTAEDVAHWTAAIIAETEGQDEGRHRR